MQILYMNATFGRLDRSELTLQPGMNIICAPNESGKSTWSHFIRNMLYGVSTKAKGLTADKNRFAPWGGASMFGRMDVEAGGDALTIQRSTRRANAPMGDFSCTYTGTATPAPHITGQNAGIVLLGVPAEVFARSAFIGQSALTVDQDAELERRIAALITTGEEDTSYSETLERLKKQLHQRRYNKSGRIPALERDCGDLSHALEALAELQGEYSRAEAQLTLLRERQTYLTQQLHQWELLEKRGVWEQYRQACQQTDQASAHLTALQELAGQVPDEATLSRLENRCAILAAGAEELREAMAAAECADADAVLAQRRCAEHPLYPADEALLRHRIDGISPPETPSSHPGRLLTTLSVCALVAAVVMPALRLRPVWWIAATAAGIVSGIGALAWRSRRRRINARRRQLENERDALVRQAEEYLPLRQASQDASDRAAGAAQFCQIAHKQQASGIASLLTDLSPYRTAATPEEASAAVAELRRQKNALDTARQSLRDLLMRRELLEQRLPEGEAPELSAPLPQPDMTPSQLRDALAQSANSLRAVQTQLDTLKGQIRSMGDEDDLIGRRAHKQEQLRRLQTEYDAISLAMEILETTHLTLQNRFSPALGARAAEIFAAITAGKYRRVLLDRDFSLAAEAADDPARRDVRLLSQGAADQLYLSVRLAICDMVLPADRSIPLIIDDALVSFDELRLRATLDYLMEESCKRQILLFTCQHRERNYLAGRAGVNIVEL